MSLGSDKKRIAIVISVILLISLVLGSLNTACIRYVKYTGEEEDTFQPAQPTPGQESSFTDIPKGVTGTINVEPAVDLVTTTIRPSGGTVTVTKPGDPLDGLQIEVPPNAYADTRTFKISSAPVQNHTFGPDFNPISPLITVDNGGGYSEDPMIVRIPVTIPEGHFAMAFFYDAASQSLEGIPLVDEDSSSITVVTRHFSNFVVTKIAFESLLKTKTIDSGFKPGVDDWQFVNWGSYIAPGGHCSGQSLSAMWYYYEKRLKGAKPLHGLYDNNGNGDTAMWEDDSLGYRLASVVQADYAKGRSLLEKLADYLAKERWDKLAWWSFVYSMKFGEPQWVGMLSSQGGGHVIIAYKILTLDDMNGTLYVADPNYPGDTREIYFVDGKFKPYNSGANANALGQPYEYIEYCPKSALVYWPQLTKRWGEFYAKTIGNVDDNKFPVYNLMVVNAEGQKYRLTDGLTTTEPELSVVVDPLSQWYLKLYTDIASTKFDMDWNERTKPLPKIKLKPGRNLLGFAILGNPPANPSTEYKYVDFKWVNVYLQTLTIEPAALTGETNKYYGFTAKINNPPDGVEYEWYVDGDNVRSGKENQINLKFNKEKTYNITVKLRDKGSGGYIGEASAVATIYGEAYYNLSITPTTSTGEPNKDYKFTALTTNPPDEPIYEWFVDGKSKGFDQKNWTYLKFDTAGPHEIIVTLVDNKAGSTVGRASAVIDIKGETKPPEPAKTESRIFKTKKVHMILAAIAKDELTITDGSTSMKEKIEIVDVPFGFDIPITWNGTSFSGQFNQSDADYTDNAEISGTVSADGLTVTSITGTSQHISGQTGWEHTCTSQLSVMDVPVVDTSGVYARITGPDIASSLVTAAHTETQVWKVSGTSERWELVSFNFSKLLPPQDMEDARPAYVEIIFSY